MDAVEIELRDENIDPTEPACSPSRNLDIFNTNLDIAIDLASPLNPHPSAPKDPERPNPDGANLRNPPSRAITESRALYIEREKRKKRDKSYERLVHRKIALIHEDHPELAPRFARNVATRLDPIPQRFEPDTDPPALDPGTDPPDRPIEPAPEIRTLTFLCHNINGYGRYNEKVAQDPLYLALVDENEVDFCCSLETHVGKDHKEASLPLPDCRKEIQFANPINPKKKQKRKTNSNLRSRLSGGVIVNIRKRVQPLVSDILASVRNPYIWKGAIHAAALIFVFIYCPPLGSLNDEITDPNRFRIVKQMLLDMHTICSFARNIGYKLLIMGDPNARIPALTGDHAANAKGSSLWAPFIEAESLHLVNNDASISASCGAYTCFPATGGSSIVDIALVNENWRNMDTNITFRVCPARYGSDHHPIIVTAQCELRELPRKPVNLIYEPPMRMTTDFTDEGKNQRFVGLFKERIFAAQGWLDDLNALLLQGSANSLKTCAVEERRTKIDKVYDHFTNTMKSAMIDAGILVAKRNRRREHQLRADEILKKLLRTYRRTVEAATDPTTSRAERARLRVQSTHLEEALQSRKAALLQSKHRQLTERIHTYDRDGVQGAMLRTIKGAETDSIVFEHNGRRLFTRWDISVALDEYFRERIGIRVALPTRTSSEADAMLREIERLSFEQDERDGAHPYTEQEFQKALRSRGLSKAVGLDNIAYRVFRLLSDNDADCNRLLTRVYTGLTNIATAPTQWHSARMALLKKKPHVVDFHGLRPVTLQQNAKTLCDQLRFARTSHLYRAALHPNQAAYVPGSSCELLVHALFIAIFRVASQRGQVYLSTNDIKQAFDRCNRPEMIRCWYNTGVGGRYIRMLIDQWMHSRMTVTYDGVAGHEQPVGRGLEQGGTEAGPAFNIYKRDLVAYLNGIMQLKVHGKNISKVTYSDDGRGTTASKSDMQRLVTLETNELPKFGMENQAAKSTSAVYSRSPTKHKALLAELREAPLLIRGDPIPVNQIGCFLGINYDMDKLEFTRHHFTVKIETFTGLIYVLKAQLVLGSDLKLSIQRDYYLIVVRAALTYGLKILVFTDEMYTVLEVLQNKFMRTILGAPASSSPSTLRIVLDIPPLSHQLASLCCAYYWDCFHGEINTWREIITLNYREYFDKFRRNGYVMKGVDQQFMNPTRQYLIALSYLKIGMRYADPTRLPARAKWSYILRNSIKEERKADLKQCLAGNGALLFHLLGSFTSLSAPESAPDILSHIEELMEVCDVSTHTILPINKMLLNCLHTYKDSRETYDDLDIDDTNAVRRARESVHHRLCKRCGERLGIANLHYLFECTTLCDLRPPELAHDVTRTTASASLFGGMTAHNVLNLLAAVQKRCS